MQAELSIETELHAVHFDRDVITFWQRVDPGGLPYVRCVGRLDARWGPWQEGPPVRDHQTVIGDGVRLTVHDDGLTVIRGLRDIGINYEYQSRIDAKWSRGVAGKWMWADEHGGSIVLGRYTDDSGVDNVMRGAIASGAPHGVAILPSRLMDDAKLYASGARPHVYVALDSDNVQRFLDEPALWDVLVKRRFGAIVVFEGCYAGGSTPQAIRGSIIPRYVFPDEDRTHRFVGEGLRRGFKMLSYFEPKHWLQFHWANIIREIRDFNAKHGFTGVYLDGLNLANDWLEAYYAVKALAEFGPIYAHNSVDVWGALSGLVATPILAHCTWSLHGESTAIITPDDAYVQYVSQPRLHGCISDHKRHPNSVGGDDTDLMVEIADWGSRRLGYAWGGPLADWDVHFKEQFNLRFLDWQTENE